MSKSGKPKRLEDLLARLEGIAKSLEAEDADLEQSIVLFEEGVEIARQCHQRLDEAERKVEILRQLPTGEVVAEPFEEEN